MSRVPSGLYRRMSAALVAVSIAVLHPGTTPTAAGQHAMAGTLTENIVIPSAKLGYDLQYRVYLPAVVDAELPVIYMTDGQWYIESGEMHRVLDQLISDGSIEPVIAIFIDNRDPENLRNNRRNQQFFCNPDYIDFVSNELVPAIDDAYQTRREASARVILGLSFGGLNSACFGLYAHDTFEGIAMQSPAMHPVKYIFSAYEDSTRLPIDVFLSSGSQQDNEERTRRLRDILRAKGYPMEYREVPYGHNWNNWKPLIDDVLTYYFGTGKHK